MPQSQLVNEGVPNGLGSAGHCGAAVTVAAGPHSKAAQGHAAAAAAAQQQQQQRFSQQLWRRVEGSVFRRIMEHPFLQELMEGSLPEDSFRFYIGQDVLYLREYSRALALVGERAPRPEWAALLGSCSRDACQMELGFHKELLSQLSGSGGSAAGEPRPAAVASPNTLLYTGHLLSTIHERPFHEGLAAVLPCFVVYHHVGLALRAQGSKHPIYQRWIDKYCGEDFSVVVAKVEAMVDEVARELSAQQLEEMHGQVLTGCRMEYLFWDAAYHQQAWPV